MNLTARIGAGGKTTLFQRDSQQSDGYLLSRSQQNILFTSIRTVRDSVRQGQKAIGFTAHSRNYNHYIMASTFKTYDFLDNLLLDALNRPHGGAAKLQY